MMAQYEKEKSELKTRVTMAESQNKNLTDQLSSMAKMNGDKVKQMKALMTGKGIDVSKF